MLRGFLRKEATDQECCVPHLFLCFGICQQSQQNKNRWRRWKAFFWNCGFKTKGITVNDVSQGIQQTILSRPEAQFGRPSSISGKKIDMTLEQGLTKSDFRLQDFCGQINSQ